jgi:hypothetical protein
VASYVAAILLVAAVALFVAAPLAEGVYRRRRAGADRAELERLEHERGLAIQGLRELAFDHEMGKLSDADYHTLRASLEARALAVMSAQERARRELPAAALKLATRRPAPTPSRPSAAPLAEASGARFCPQCGGRAATGANFCVECGTPLLTSVRRVSQAD